MDTLGTVALDAHAGTGTVVAVIAAALLLLIALPVLAVRLVRRIGGRRLQVSALEHELFVHGRSRDRKIGEFRGFAHAVAFADRQKRRGPRQTMYLVSDPAKPGPFWVRVEEIEGLNHDRRRVVGYAAPPGGERDVATIEAECRRRGWRLVEVVWETGSRTGLRRALELIAGGEATCLMVVGLDRLVESASELADVVDWLAEARAFLVTVSPPLDTSTEEGVRAAGVVAALGDAERASATQGVSPEEGYVPLPYRNGRRGRPDDGGNGSKKLREAPARRYGDVRPDR